MSVLNSPHVGKSFVRMQINDYGEDSSEYRCHVLGLFPTEGAGALIDRVAFEACIRPTAGVSTDAQCIMGVDIANEEHKGDRHAIAVRRGAAVIYLDTFYGTHEDLEEQIYTLAASYGVSAVYLDALGLHSLLTRLFTSRRMPHVLIDGVVASATALEKQKYVNRRTEVYMRLRLWFKHNANIAITPCALALQLAEELEATHYRFSKDTFHLKSKDVIRSIIRRSPDIADALSYTFAAPEGETHTVGAIIEPSTQKYVCAHNHYAHRIEPSQRRRAFSHGNRRALSPFR